MHKTVWWKQVRQKLRDGVWKAAGSIRQLRGIASLQLTKELTNRIRRTYLGTVVLRRYDSHNMVANVVGFQTRFCSLESLVYLFREIFLEQQYHFDTKKTNPYIIDCGSNIGMSLLYFKMIYPACEILAFEPEEQAFACLAANVKANGLQSVRLNKKALSNREGPTVLFSDPDDPGSIWASTMRGRMAKQEQPAQGTPLSAYIDREVDFLKMDVEGMEGAILEDLAATGKLSSIKEMVVEFHHHLDPNADSLSHFLRLLEDGGFGYEIRARPRLPFRRREFEDILIYAYRKDD